MRGRSPSNRLTHFSIWGDLTEILTLEKYDTMEHIYLGINAGISTNQRKCWETRLTACV